MSQATPAFAAVELAGGPARFNARASKRARVLVWALVLRVFALFVATELSGLAHVATDVCEALAGHEQHYQVDDCDDDQAGHECPPGCPNCHCSHAAVVVSVVLANPPSLRPLPRSVRPVGFVPYSEMVPPGADPESLYRPPRVRA